MKQLILLILLLSGQLLNASVPTPNDRFDAMMRPHDFYDYNYNFPRYTPPKKKSWEEIRKKWPIGMSEEELVSNAFIRDDINLITMLSNLKWKVGKVKINQCSDNELLDELKSDYDRAFRKGQSITRRWSPDIFGNELTKTFKVRVKGSLTEFKVLNVLLGDKIPEDWKLRIIRNKCSDVKCVVKTLYHLENAGENSSFPFPMVTDGEQAYYKLMLMAYKFGYHLSIDRKLPVGLFGTKCEEFLIWHQDEIHHLYHYFDNLPKNLHHIGSAEKIQKCFYPEIDGEKGRAGMDVPLFIGKLKTGGILIEGIKDENKSVSEFTMTHELGHHLDFMTINNVLNHRKEVLSYRIGVQQLNWHPETGEKNTDEGCFFEHHGEKNHYEDFAYQISGFFHKKKAFKKKCPAQFRIIRDKLFNGYEYPEYGFSQRLALDILRKCGNVTRNYRYNCTKELIESANSEIKQMSCLQRKSLKIEFEKLSMD